MLRELTHAVGCRGIFSTHYHRLATEHETDPTVRFRTCLQLQSNISVNSSLVAFNDHIIDDKPAEENQQ